MIRTATRALSLILGMLLIAAPGFTQTALATLRGVALDQQGGVLPGVTITVRQADTVGPKRRQQLGFRFDF